MLLKRNLVEAPIFRFHNWLNKFHVQIDTLGILVDVILTQLGDDGLDHLICMRVKNIIKLNETIRPLNVKHWE